MARILIQKDREAAFWLYMILGALFIASLITCNLIFRKFFFWEPFQGEESGSWTYVFEQSVGLLPYPITFLITDLISEIFGRKKANQIVIAGLAASLFVLVIVTIAGAVPATSWSPVSDEQFYHVFGQTILAIGSSMIAYLFAQFIDIRKANTSGYAIISAPSHPNS
jgi:queuosine precursor transporter